MTAPRVDHDLLWAVVEGSPDPVFVKDRDGRYLMINAAGAAFIGRPVEDIIGRGDRELFRPEAARLIEAGDRQVLASGETVVIDEEIGPPGGERRIYLATKAPFRAGDGSVVGVIGIARDVTERRRAEQELAAQVADMTRLHELSLRLTSTVGLEPMLHEVLSAATGLTHADMGLIRLRDPVRGDLYPVASVGFDPDYFARMGRVSTAAYERAIREGRTAVSEDIESEPAFEPYLEAMRAGGYRATAFTPLLGLDGELVGTIAVYFREHHRPDDREIRLLELYARQAAQLIEHARLHDELGRIARTLQAALLPPDLPEVPGVGIGSRYRPAGEWNEAGGDFYDVFAVAEDRWVAVIGDVCGKGPDAAALTALVRHSLRALSLRESSPAAMLELANRAVLDQTDADRFCTAVCCVLERHASGVRVTVASGGHPLPLVVRAGGSVEQVGAPGTLLGVVPDVTLTESTVELAPGDVIALYTDGVSDAWMPDAFVGVSRLSSLLRAHRDRSAEGLAARIEADVLGAGRGEPRDDMALLILKVEPVGVAPPGGPPVPPVTTLSARLPCEPASIAASRAAAAALEPHLSAERFATLRLLVSEVVTNAVRHSGAVPPAELAVHLRLLHDRVAVEVADPGGAPDVVPRAHRGRDPRAAGWGLFLVDELAERWGVAGGGGTRVWFELAR